MTPSTRQPPPSRLIVPCSLAGSGNTNWTCPKERRRFLFWVCTLFRLGLYLFRCKSACKSVTSCPCVVGGVLGLIWWRKSAPQRLELCRLFSIIRLLLMWRGDIMQPHPSKQGWWERAPTPISYSLLSTVRMLDFTSCFNKYEAVSAFKRIRLFNHTLDLVPLRWLKRWRLN